MKEDVMPKRPWTVTAAHYLLWLSVLVLPAIRILWKWSEGVISSDILLGIARPVLVIALGGWLLMLLLVYMIGRGRNGARIFFLVLFLLLTPFELISIIQSSGQFAFGGPLFKIYQLEIAIVAMVLLFQRSSSDWFYAVKELRKQDAAPAAT